MLATQILLFPWMLCESTRMGGIRLGPHPASLTEVRMGMWGHSSPETVPALQTPRTQQERGVCAKKCEPLLFCH